MGHRSHPAPTPLLFGYDPGRDLPADHLARLVELVVEEATLPRSLPAGRGQPAFDPRLCAKVLLYGYATGARSSRQLERLCSDSLPFLFLTRGDAPSYRTLCSFRVQHTDVIEQVWLQLFGVAERAGMKRLGRVVLDSSKLRADAGPEAVLKRREFQPFLDHLRSALKEAQESDARDEADPPGQARTGQPADTAQMRELLRSVRRQIARERKAVLGEEASAEPAARPPLGPRMEPRIKAASAAVEAAQEAGGGFVCVTDPDACMMGEGREKRIHECHSYEVAVDEDAGLLVVGRASQSPVDNPRLEPLLEAAALLEPGGIRSVTADSGYYGGDAVGRLLGAGIDVCIPDSNTAGDLHRGQPIGTIRSASRGSVALEYDAEADCYRCPEGNALLRSGRRQDCGQSVGVYRAERPCTGCPLAKDCLTQAGAKHRTVKRGEYADILEAARQRFGEPAHQDRYHRRGSAVETVFGFLRSALGFHRWSVRGKDRVASEARLFSMAYQLRKAHVKWSQTMS